MALPDRTKALVEAGVKVGGDLFLVSIGVALEKDNTVWNHI